MTIPTSVLERAALAQWDATTQRPAKVAEVQSVRIHRADHGYVITITVAYDGVAYDYAESVNPDGVRIGAGLSLAPERHDAQVA